MPGQLSEFMKQWKRMSSVHIHRLLRQDLRHYSQRFDLEDPVWQPKYYPFNLYSSEKTREKLAYMHQNPVRAGLVNSPADWPWSSFRYYEYGRSVGVPIRWIE
jgi:putative transposase